MCVGRAALLNSLLGLPGSSESSVSSGTKEMSQKTVLSPKWSPATDKCLWPEKAFCVLCLWWTGFEVGSDFEWSRR